VLSSAETLEALLRSGFISDDICRTLTDMQETRNQVAHIRAEEVTDEAAIEYVEQAIQMSDQLSAIPSPLVHESIDNLEAMGYDEARDRPSRHKNLHI
jgi:uncharacterized protein YutE (UPF0331/DUF86 family)